MFLFNVGFCCEIKELFKLSCHGRSLVLQDTLLNFTQWDVLRFCWRTSGFLRQSDTATGREKKEVLGLNKVRTKQAFIPNKEPHGLFISTESFIKQSYNRPHVNLQRFILVNSQLYSLGARPARRRHHMLGSWPRPHWQTLFLLVIKSKQLELAANATCLFRLMCWRRNNFLNRSCGTNSKKFWCIVSHFTGKHKKLFHKFTFCS